MKEDRKELWAVERNLDAGSLDQIRTQDFYDFFFFKNRSQSQHKKRSNLLMHDK